MQVDRVKASLRYSRDTGNGWKTVELGAEASLGPQEKWQEAGAQMYTELSASLTSLWARGTFNGDKAEESPELDQPAHWCQEHSQEFRRYEKQTSKGLSAWYSHRVEGGGWCKEKAEQVPQG